MLGGAYSSTFTTLVMASLRAGGKAPHGYSGGILIASGVMYLRFLVLIGFLMHNSFAAYCCHFWCWEPSAWRAAGRGPHCRTVPKQARMQAA